VVGEVNGTNDPGWGKGIVQRNSGAYYYIVLHRTNA
jgi:hypothetical protein